MFFVIPTEYFSKGIGDKKSIQGQNVYLECEVTKNIETVTWLKDGTNIEVSERFEFHEEQNKCSLWIKDVTVNDTGLYSVIINGKGKSTGSLQVAGQYVDIVTG